MRHDLGVPQLCDTRLVERKQQLRNESIGELGVQVQLCVLCTLREDEALKKPRAGRRAGGADLREHCAVRVECGARGPRRVHGLLDVYLL